MRKKSSSTAKQKTAKKFSTKNISRKAAAKKNPRTRRRAFSKKHFSSDAKRAISSRANLSQPLLDSVVQEASIPPASVQCRVEPQKLHYNLPLKYGDDRIVLLARDPWWLHTYWDISQDKIDAVIASIPAPEHGGLRWILRVYDVSGIKNFHGGNALSFFDLDIYFDASSWYINVNQPERSWCVEIGLISAGGNFYPVARSNVVGTPYFGVSSSIDEEWALPDEDYYRVLGAYDLGRSSMERKRKFEEIIKQQISSPLASWGISSRPGPGIKDKFFLEVWTEVILHGRTEHDAEVRVEGKKIKLNSDGTFSLRYSLPVGDFQFAVEGVSRNKKHKLRKVPAVKRYNK